MISSINSRNTSISVLAYAPKQTETNKQKCLYVVPHGKEFFRTVCAWISDMKSQMSKRHIKSIIMFNKPNTRLKWNESHLSLLVK